MAQPETPAVSAVQRYPLHAYLLGHPEARERLGPSLSAALTSGQFGAAPFEGPLQFSAMHAAALADDAEAVALLAAAGCPINASSARNCDRAIMLAASPRLKPDSRLLAHQAFRQAADLWALLQPALDPELQGAYQAGSLVDGECSQATPLCVAVRMQHVAAAEALLQLGAPPDQRMPVNYQQDYDADGCNVTLLAAVAGGGRLVPYLPSGVTPERQHLARLLLAHGADPCAAPASIAIAMNTPVGLAVRQRSKVAGIMLPRVLEQLGYPQQQGLQQQQQQQQQQRRRQQQGLQQQECPQQRQHQQQGQQQGEQRSGPHGAGSTADKAPAPVQPATGGIATWQAGKSLAFRVQLVLLAAQAAVLADNVDAALLCVGAAAKLLELSTEQDPPLGWDNGAAELLYEAASAGKDSVVAGLLRKLGQRFADGHVMHFAKVQAAAAGHKGALQALTKWDRTSTTWLQQQQCQAQVLSRAIHTCCLAGVRLVLHNRSAQTLAMDWLVYHARQAEGRMQFAGGAAWAVHPVTRLVQAAPAAQAHHASSATQELEPRVTEADAVGIAEELVAAGFLVDHAALRELLPRNHPVRLALQRPAWEPEQHSRFPARFRTATAALLLAHARLRRSGAPARGRREAAGGAGLGDLPAELLPLVIGCAAYPVSAWIAGSS